MSVASTIYSVYGNWRVYESWLLRSSVLCEMSFLWKALRTEYEDVRNCGLELWLNYWERVPVQHMIGVKRLHLFLCF